MSGTLFFLSSGARPRYKVDIVRSLALPRNGRLVIRYMRKYVQDDVWELLGSGQAAGCTGLFAYLDQNIKPQRPSVIPCRYSRIERSEREGQFVVVSLKMNGFPVLPNQESVDQRIVNAFPELPRWKQEADGIKLRGLFALTSEREKWEFEESFDVERWQEIVDRIGSRSDYLDQSFFPYVEGIYHHTKSGKRRVIDIDGILPLKAAESYELKIGHFHPHRPLQNPQPTGWLLVDPDGSLSVTRNRAIEADSPYSLNYVRLRTDHVRLEETAAVSIFMVKSSTSRPDVEDGSHLLDIPLTVKPRHFRNIGLALAIGIFLGAPHAVRLMPDDQGFWLKLMLIFVPSIIAATLAVYAVRKPV
ncbi:MAG: hypothetical protein U9Q81_24630 [Pseudomonadota bacterium]|nr:hypothetical protein [Pseudomonadota bacterium]